MATAGIILIGDELLTGQTSDLNLPHLAPRLFEKGVHLEEVRIINDRMGMIVDTVRHFSKTYTYVFTTGGIGPTHDDITAEAIAKAFDLPLVPNPEALLWMENHYGPAKSPAMQKGRERMATMPQGVELIQNEVTGAAGFKIRNVYVMAGIPQVMQAMFEVILPTLQGHNPKSIRNIFCAIAESKIAEPLGAIQNQYPAVEIGSYPIWQNQVSLDLKITLKSAAFDELEHVTDLVYALCDELGGNPRLG